MIIQNKQEKKKVTKIGNYYLINQIGKGAYSKVYLAEKMKGTQYAIKKISIIDLNQYKKKCLEHQVNILTSIRHINIVQFYQLKKSSNNFYLVFQYCQNSDLQRYIKQYYNGKVPEQKTRQIFNQLSQAFKILRQNKIVHRDLKLSNILVDKQFVFKIADFGFAKYFQNDLMKSTIGTPITMAPQILNRKNYNQTCDLWSLGVILYQLLFGKYPYYPTNKMDVLKSLSQNIENKKLTFPQQIPISQSLKQLICKMLTKQSERISFDEFFNHPWINLKGNSDLTLQMRNLVIEKDIKKNITSMNEFSKLKIIRKK